MLETIERPTEAIPFMTPAIPSVTGKTAHQQLVVVAWSDDLDKIWPTLILATTAAASGMRTTIFFTFWGLFSIVKNDVRITGENWMQRMLALMNRGGTRHLRLSKMNFLGAGPAMMNKLAKDHNVASPQELLDIARELGVRLVPCQMTMDLMGLKREDLVEGIEEPAGAMSAIEDMKDAVTLFI
jgi:peroxiredoxin family protein